LTGHNLSFGRVLVSGLYKVDFDEIYLSSDDPWFIGGANSSRFDRYLSLIKEFSGLNKRCVDVGCGNGAFSKRLSGYVEVLKAIDSSTQAILTAKSKYSAHNISYQVLSAGNISEIGEKFDVLNCSDSLYYMDDIEIEKFIFSLSTVLHHGATCFFSAWCPGGDYYTELDFVDVVSDIVEIIYVEKISSEFVQSGRYLMVIGKFV
jgi:2-polyprenyl-3-methyl-5-hydroxy-6-metoxy-1,4-benzoquinol methylase